jgi:hypothetical protein
MITNEWIPRLALGSLHMRTRNLRYYLSYVVNLPDLLWHTILVLDRGMDEVFLDPTNKCDLVLTFIFILLYYKSQLARCEFSKVKRTQSRDDINSSVAAADLVSIYDALVPGQWLPYFGNILIILEVASGCDEDRRDRFYALVPQEVVRLRLVYEVVVAQPHGEAIHENILRGSRIPANEELFCCFNLALASP